RTWTRSANRNEWGEFLDGSPISLYTAHRDAKRAGDGGSPHGVGNVVFGAWLPTFERAGRGREGLRSQDRGYWARGRWTRADPELRRVRPRDEGRGSGEDPDHEGPPPDGLRRSSQGMIRPGGRKAGMGRAIAACQVFSIDTCRRLRKLYNNFFIPAGPHRVRGRRPMVFTRAAAMAFASSAALAVVLASSLA